MHNKLSLGWFRASRCLDVRLPRTRALLLGLLLAVTGWLPLAACAEMDINLLGDMVLIEAGGENQRMGGGELEASMHSSLLRDFQEVTEEIRAMDVGDAAATRQNAATLTAFPDSSAVVGRIFQMKVPNKMEDVYLGDIVKVRNHNTNTTLAEHSVTSGRSLTFSVSSWLHEVWLLQLVLSALICPF